MNAYEGTQVVDYGVVCILGPKDPAAIMTPSFDVEDLTDLGNRVELYPGSGMAIPVRSAIGPITVRVSVGRSGPHPDALAPTYTWASSGPVDLGGRPLVLSSAATPTDGFTYIALPADRVWVNVAWSYGPKPAPEMYDHFGETLLLSFWE